MKNIDFTGLAYLGALGIAVYIGWRVIAAAPKTARAALDAAKEAGAAVVDKFNPASSNNVVYQLTGAESLFRKAFDATMSDPNELQNQKLGQIKGNSNPYNPGAWTAQGIDDTVNAGMGVSHYLNTEENAP